MKFAPIVIPAMALLQQHDARQDILIEPAACQHAVIEACGHSELGRSELGRNRAVKTNQLVEIVDCCHHGVSCRPKKM